MQGRKRWFGKKEGREADTELEEAKETRRQAKNLYVLDVRK